MKQAYAILLSLSLATLALAAPASAEDGTYTCEVTIGLDNPVVGVSTSVGSENLGGCNLVTISETSVAESVDPAEGCTIQVDVDDDNVADDHAEEGTEYPTNSRFVAFCDAGVTDAVNSLTLAPADQS